MGDQAEESEEITVVGVEYKILKHRRQKYRCRCNEQVMTAPGPAKLIPGGRYSVDFAVHVAEQKYLDHLPLERQVRAMGRSKPRHRQPDLWDQISVLARHLEPTYEALCSWCSKDDVVYADETFWRNHENKNTSEVVDLVRGVRQPRHLSHREEHAHRRRRADVLGGFEGIVMTDGYGAYKALEQQTAETPACPLLGACDGESISRQRTPTRSSATTQSNRSRSSSRSSGRRRGPVQVRTVTRYRKCSRASSTS